METFHRDILFWSWWETTWRRKTSRACNHGNTRWGLGEYLWRTPEFKVEGPQPVSQVWSDGAICHPLTMSLSGDHVFGCDCQLTLRVSLWTSGSNNVNNCRAWSWCTTEAIPVSTCTHTQFHYTQAFIRDYKKSLYMCVCVYTQHGAVGGQVRVCEQRCRQFSDEKL